MAKNQSSSKTLKRTPDQTDATILEFDDNYLLAQLVGEHDRYLARIEQGLDVSVVSRGNKMAISGSNSARASAKSVLLDLYERLKKASMSRKVKSTAPFAWRATPRRKTAAAVPSPART